MRNFNPSSQNPARAIQAWQILISKARNRQTVTYLDLSQLMYKKNAAGVLAKILGHLAFHCEDNSLPPLTAIVVGKWQGKPGAKIPINLAHVDDEREKVYRYDWFDVFPPSEAELTQAYRKRHP
jgi:hypothetical protein